MNISEKLYNLYFEKNIPLSVSIEVTRKCVNRCIHCYLNETQNPQKISCELSLTEIKKIFKELKDLGVIFLNITGGEPLLRKDIEEIIKQAVNYNFYVKLFSSLNSDFSIIDKLYDVGLRDIDVSLYGQKNIHNLITCSKSFDLIVDNIKKAKKKGFKITIKTPVMNMNINEIKWIKKFALENQVYFKIDPIITPRNNKDLSSTKYSVSIKDFGKIFKKDIFGFKKNKEKYKDKKEYMPCGAMRCVLGVDCYGNLIPCLAFPLTIGNAKKNKIKDILKSKEAEDIRKKLEIEPQKCVKCNYKITCSRCVGVAWLYSADINYIYESACLISQKAYKIK